MPESVRSRGSRTPPLVSVVIPVYRREKLIGPCIESALAQTWRSLEVVVVDNASEDGTFEICSRLAEGEPRLRVFRNETNLGPVRNWARGLAEARGEYVKFLFSDDLLAPSCVERLMALMSDQVGVAFSAASVSPHPWTGPAWYRWRSRAGPYDSGAFIEDALFGARGTIPVSPGAALFRLAEARGDLSAEIPSPTFTDFAQHGAGPDLLLSLRAAARRPKVGFTPEVLSFFRMHPSSITTSNFGMVTERYRQARLHFAEGYRGGHLLGRTLACEWLRAGATGRAGGREAFALRMLARPPARSAGRAALDAAHVMLRWARPRAVLETLRLGFWLMRLRLDGAGKPR